MVETAVMLPIFVIIVLGTIETCSMIFLKQSLEIAAYEGARAAIVPRSQLGQVTYTSNEMLKQRHVNNGTITVTPSNFPSLPYGTIIKVTVSAPCDANSLLPGGIYAGRTLTADVEMMKEY